MVHHEHEDVRRMQEESWALRYDLHRLFIENQITCLQHVPASRGRHTGPTMRGNATSLRPIASENAYGRSCASMYSGSVQPAAHAPRAS